MHHELIGVPAGMQRAVMRRPAPRRLSTVIVHKAVDILRKSAASA
jgi:hypothetical protein